MPRLYNAAFSWPRRANAGACIADAAVPFGEFIPLQRGSRFLRARGRLATFAAGDDVTMLPIGRHRRAPAICYEVIFPSVCARGASRRQRAAHDESPTTRGTDDVGAVPALRAGVDARHRAGRYLVARGQYRYQWRRGSVRAGVGEVGYL
jgi:hypothetical protein